MRLVIRDREDTARILLVKDREGRWSDRLLDDWIGRTMRWYGLPRERLSVEVYP